MWLLGLILLGIAIAVFTMKRSGGSVSYSSNAKYVAHYRNSRTRVPLPTVNEATGSAQGMPSCKFLLSAKAQLQRDYVLLIDRSGSMSTGRRWRDACNAVKTLAPYVCKFDPDGINLFFFDHDVLRFENITNPTVVESVFEKHKPRGSTNLAKALHAALEDHFNGKRGATTILVVTDGAPDSKSEVRRILMRASNSVEELDELSISFIQIGDESGATKFLEELDDDLVNQGAKMDIVDTITSEECSRISFSELVARSIYD